MNSQLAVSEVITFFENILAKISDKPTRDLEYSQWKIYFNDVNYHVYVNAQFRGVCVNNNLIKIMYNTPLDIIKSAIFKSNISASHRKQLCTYLSHAIVDTNIEYLETRVNEMCIHLQKIDNQLYLLTDAINSIINS